MKKTIISFFLSCIIVFSCVIPSFAANDPIVDFVLTSGFSAAFNSVVQFTSDTLSLLRSARFIKSEIPFVGGVAGSSGHYSLNFTEVSYNDLVSICSALSQNSATAGLATYKIVKATDLNNKTYSPNSGKGWMERTDWYYILMTFTRDVRAYVGWGAGFTNAFYETFSKGNFASIGNSAGIIYVAHSNTGSSNYNVTNIENNTYNTYTSPSVAGDAISSALAEFLDRINSNIMSVVNAIGQSNTWNKAIKSGIDDLNVSLYGIRDLLFSDLVTDDNILAAINQFYNLFDARFSDLDLTYYNDSEITIYNGENVDWSESDRGAIDIEANDIGTLELSGFPNADGYRVSHSIGGDIVVERNDGTYFPNEWDLSGGTVTMPTIESAYSSITVTAPVGTTITVAGNTHTFDDDVPYVVNVEFGTYTVSGSYVDNGTTLTADQEVVVDGYNDYAVEFTATPGWFTVSFRSVAYASDFLFYIYDHVPSSVNDTSGRVECSFVSGTTYDLPLGSFLSWKFVGWQYSYRFYVNGIEYSEAEYALFGSGEKRHIVPGENDQFRPKRNRQQPRLVI